MNEKVIEILKDKTLNISNVLLKNYKKLNITDSEFILLIYLLNNDICFNPKEISKDLSVSIENVMDYISSLSSKGILKIDLTKGRVKEEYINLEGLYNKLFFLLVKGEEKKSTNIFDIFEKEFGRTLSPMDFEIISLLQKDNSDELIILALREAVFNGVSNLRYIDKILHEWGKKGIKTEEDIIKDKKNFESKKSNKKLFDYDWLNERDS